MITTFATLKSEAASGSATIHLEIGGDIILTSKLVVADGKVVHFGNYKFIRANIVPTTLTAATDAGGGHTSLTVGSSAGYAIGAKINIANSTAGRYNTNGTPWEILDIPSGGVTLTINAAYNGTSNSGDVSSEAVEFTISAYENEGGNTKVTINSGSTTVPIRGSTVHIVGSIPSAYNGTWEVLSDLNNTQIILARPYVGGISGGSNPKLRSVPIQFDGYTDARRQQIFRFFNPGDIRGNFNTHEVFPEWWGLEAGYHDRAINAAIKTYRPTHLGNAVSLAARQYDVSAPLDLRNSLSRLIGPGSGATKIVATENWAPPGNAWERSFIFSFFTSTESYLNQTNSHSAIIWIGSPLATAGDQSYRTGVTGVHIDGTMAVLANPKKHVSLISSAGYVEENSIIDDVVLVGFSGFAIGFHNTDVDGAENSVVNGLSIDRCRSSGIFSNHLS